MEENKNLQIYQKVHCLKLIKANTSYYCVKKVYESNNYEIAQKFRNAKILRSAFANIQKAPEGGSLARNLLRMRNRGIVLNDAVKLLIGDKKDEVIFSRCKRRCYSGGKLVGCKPASLSFFEKARKQIRAPCCNIQSSNSPRGLPKGLRIGSYSVSLTACNVSTQTLVIPIKSIYS